MRAVKPATAASAPRAISTERVATPAASGITTYSTVDRISVAQGTAMSVTPSKNATIGVRSLPEDQIKLSDIGVLCARRADADRVRVALRAAGMETVMLQSGADDRSVQGVRITTVHRAKGLEFFTVAIPFLSDTAFPPPGALRTAVGAADREDIVTQYRSLLHVAATRAKKALRVSWSGALSSLVRS